MGRACTVCVHPKRDELNRKLLDPGQSPSRLAEAYGLSHSAVDRHKANHLKVSTGLVSEARNALTVVGFASDLYDRAIRVLDRAEQVLAADDGGARSVQAAAASLREVRGSIELLARLVVTAPPEPEDRAHSWLDQALTDAVSALALPTLPSSAPALASGVEEAVIVEAAD